MGYKKGSPEAAAAAKRMRDAKKQNKKTSEEDVKRRGYFEPGRHTDFNLPIERPKMPSGLRENAKRAWNRIVNVLHECGVMTKMDFLAIQMLCETILIYEKANEDVRKNGIKITNSKGDQVANPAVKIRDDAMKGILGIARDYGMTPKARNALHGLSLLGNQEQEEKDRGASILTVPYKDKQ